LAGKPHVMLIRSNLESNRSLPNLSDSDYLPCSNRALNRIVRVILFDSSS